MINKLYKDKQIDLEEVLESIMEHGLYENEYMHFVANDGSKQSAVGILRNGKINLINADITTYGGIRGKNLSQKCLLHALMQPAEEIPLVIAKDQLEPERRFCRLPADLTGHTMTMPDADTTKCF